MANLSMMREGTVDRIAKGLVLGLVAGVLVGLAVGAAFEDGDVFGWWGTVDGALAGVIVFLVVVARGRAKWARSVARWLLVTVLAVVAGLTLWWNIAWRVTPWTLEGMWLWPMAVAALAATAFAVRAALNARRGDT